MYDTRYKVECAWEGCTQPAKSSYSTSKSKYCAECAPKAYKAWQKAKDEQEAARNEKYEKFQALYAKALEAGWKAFEDAKPVPMVVQQHASPLDDSSEVVQEWHVPEGVCGMAWLTIRPGNTSFAHWAKKNQGARKAYYGGLEIWRPVGGSTQSYERQMAGVRAMQDVLMDEDEGLPTLDPKSKVYAGGRLD